MPPFLLSPFVKLVLGTASVAAAAKWVAMEWRRINAELDAAQPAPATERADRNRFPTLRRDPRTGDYRPM